MQYYKQKQFIARVDKNDRIIGKIEKWEAHRKGVLHRAFTMLLYYKDCIVIQHRKHPVFDGYFDLSFSSHQIYVPPPSSRATLSEQRKSKGSRGISPDDVLEDDLTAIYKTLKREWNLNKTGIVDTPKKIGQIYYKEKDPNSDFYDHEIDYIYEGTLKELPTPSYDFAYDFKLVNNLEIRNWKLEIKLAPWVKVMIKEKLF